MKKLLVAILGLVFLSPISAFAVIPIPDNVQVNGYVYSTGVMRPDGGLSWPFTGSTFMGSNILTGEYLNYPDGISKFMDNQGNLFYMNGQMLLADPFGYLHGSGYYLTGITHSNLTGLTGDDHPGYLFLPGRANAQTIQNDIVITGALKSNDYFSGDGTQGMTGTCTLANITSITVKDGLITSCQ